MVTHARGSGDSNEFGESGESGDPDDPDASCETGASATCKIYVELHGMSFVLSCDHESVL